VAADDELGHLLAEERGNRSERAEPSHTNASGAVAVEDFEAPDRQPVSVDEPVGVAEGPGR